ncbi:MAG TPA: nuclease A inhibitor family protein [Pyrinomonadaceae bacterium]|jgi:hypothetical protein
MMKSDEELIEELRKATDGLLFMSESDYPFEIIKWGKAGDISQEYVREIVKGAAETTVEEITVDDFFRSAAAEQEWKAAPELAAAKRHQKLVRLLKENLTEVRVYRVGERNIGVYIVGRSGEGNALGVSTRVVET